MENRCHQSFWHPDLLRVSAVGILRVERICLRVRGLQKLQAYAAKALKKDSSTMGEPRAAWERAARSALAQLRWNYSQETLAQAPNAMVCEWFSPGNRFMVAPPLSPCPGKDAPAAESWLRRDQPQIAAAALPCQSRKNQRSVAGRAMRRFSLANRGDGVDTAACRSRGIQR
jgi:hypothetical protein